MLKLVQSFAVEQGFESQWALELCCWRFGRGEKEPLWAQAKEPGPLRWIPSPHGRSDPLGSLRTSSMADGTADSTGWWGGDKQRGRQVGQHGMAGQEAEGGSALSLWHVLGQRNICC